MVSYWDIFFFFFLSVHQNSDLAVGFSVFPSPENIGSYENWVGLLEKAVRPGQLLFLRGTGLFPAASLPSPATAGHCKAALALGGAGNEGFLPHFPLPNAFLVLP